MLEANLCYRTLGSSRRVLHDFAHAISTGFALALDSLQVYAVRTQFPSPHFAICIPQRLLFAASGIHLKPTPSDSPSHGPSRRAIGANSD
jgi:hypothetical protein